MELIIENKSYITLLPLMGGLSDGIDADSLNKVIVLYYRPL
jgi:hypothetical protein